MPRLSGNANLRTLRDHLLDNKGFRYAHLVKFERPALEEDITPPNEALRVETDASKYAYFTDASHSIDFNDQSTNLAGSANGTQTYVANRIKKIGSLSESTQVKMGSANLLLDATAVNVNNKIDFTYSDTNSGNTVTIVSTTTDFSAEGYREDDKIRIPLGTATVSATTSQSATVNVDNYSTTNRVPGLLLESDSLSGHVEVSSWSGNTITLSNSQSLPDNEVISIFNYARITAFSNGGKTITATLVDGAILNEGSTRTYNSGTYQGVSSTQGISAKSEEINFLLQGTMPTNYVNRQVFIHKVFLDEDKGDIIGDGLLVFQGIITSATYKEDPNGKATMSWSCKSHWGDFKRLSGRLTSADYHQALTAKGEPNSAASVKPAYAGDYGFMWAERAINLLAKYDDQVEKSRQVDINGWWFGGKRQETYYEDVVRTVDLRFDLQAKRLPTVYGVRRVKGNTVFADIGSHVDEAGTVWIAEALSEGPIQSIMNIYMDGSSLICVDAADAGARSSSDNADMVCHGRMDRGDIFLGEPNTSASSYSGTNTTTPITINTPQGEVQITTEQMDNLIDIAEGGAAGMDVNYSVQNAIQQIMAPLGKQTPTSVGNNGGAGITHERVLKYSAPMLQEFEFHMGIANQSASPELVSKAQGTGFKLQKDYYSNTAGNGVKYWGPRHQLLDTAYVVRKCVLAPGETTIPKVEYTVKGKMIACYNYDNSFTHDDADYSSESQSNFLLGDYVQIKKTSDNSNLLTDHSADNYKTIIKDKFHLYDSLGNQHYRFRWELTSDEASALVAAEKFYMVDPDNASNKWHMIVHEVAQIENLTIAEIGVTQVDNANYTTSGGNQMILPLSSPPTGLDDYFAESTTMGQFIATTSPNTTSANYNGSRLRSTNVTLTKSSNNITFPHNTAAIVPTIVVSNTILITNKLTLSSGASGTNDTYNNMWIEITKARKAGNQIIKRKIIDYNGSTKVVTLDRPFESAIDMPKVGETVRIMRQSEIVDPSSRVGAKNVAGNDIRSSSNLALILLDYLTDVRYGPNISLDDIDLDSFLYAAQVCDTGSNITVQLNANHTTNPAVGDVYKYSHSYSGDSAEYFKWQGTVSDYNTATRKVTFTNCIGKLTNRWNNWATRNKGDVMYSENDSVLPLYRITESGTGVQSSSYTTNAANMQTNNFGLVRVGSGTGSTLYVEVDKGNPVEYSLYDSYDCKFWAYLGWESHEQRWVTRHQGNIIIENSASVFDNIKGLLSHFNGMLSYVDGKYKLEVEVTRTASESDSLFTDSNSDKNIQSRYITDEDLIGSITIKDSGLDKSYNSLSANLPDPMLHYSNRSVSFFNSRYLKDDRGIVKSTNFTAVGLTNYFNARMMVKQRLDKSRFNREASFTMRPAGMNILPGELIRIESSRYGWDAAKMFRVKTVQMQEDCLVSIVAEEYDDSVYVIDPPKTSRFAIEQEGSVALLSPSDPTGTLSASSGAKGRIDLAWGASASIGVNGKYEIWRSTSNNRANAVLIGSTDALAYSDVVATGTYYYWVRAKNIQTSQSGSTTKSYYSGYLPSSATGGISGVSADVVDGDDGSDGKQTVNGVIYRINPSSSTPAAPSMTAYTFSTRAFTGGNTSDWSLSPPAITANNANNFWQALYKVTETTAQGNTGTPSYGTVTKRLDGTGDTITKNESQLDVDNLTDTGNTKAGGVRAWAKINEDLQWTGDFYYNGGVKGMGNAFTSFNTDNTEGRFSYKIGATDYTNDVFSSTERTKLNNLRAGNNPGGTQALETANNRFNIVSDGTEGRWAYNIGGGSTAYNEVFSSAERTKLNRLRLGQAPDDAAVSIKNNGINLSISGQTFGLSGAGGTSYSVGKANVGLGSVDNESASTIRSAITASYSSGTLTLGNIGGSNTASITKGTMGLSYTDGADVTGSNTSYDTSRVNGQTAANVQGYAWRAGTGLDASGNVQRTVPTNYYTNTTYSSLGAVNTAEGVKFAGIATGADVTGSNTSYDTARVNNETASTVQGYASRAGAVIDSSNRITGSLYSTTYGSISPATVYTGATRANATIDSSNRFVGNIWNGSTTISAANVHQGASRANTGLDSNGAVTQAVPQTKLSNLNTYSVDYQVVTWNKISNAGYSPSATSQLITVTWRRASDGTAVCTSTWNATINSSSNVVTSGGTITPNASGTGASNSAQTGVNGALSTVTFSRGGVSVTCTAKVNVLSGFTFKEGS
jgi:hypothetical protein